MTIHGLIAKANRTTVPSEVIPQQWNYLLNPKHAEFGQIEVGRPEQFVFDLPAAEEIDLSAAKAPYSR